MDSVLHLLGIARKGGRLEVGEEPAGAAARARQAKVLLVACDAAENSLRRAEHFAQAGQVPLVRLPHTKGELGQAVGRTSCAMLALTDVGLAAAVLEKLAVLAPAEYGGAAQQLREKAEKALRRQQERRRHEKNLQKAKKKPWAPPPRREAPPPAGKAPGNGSRPVPRGKLTIKRPSRPDKDGKA